MPQLARARVLADCPDVAPELRGIEVEVLEVMFPCEDRCGAWWCTVRRVDDGHQFEVLSNDLDPDPRGAAAFERYGGCLGRRRQLTGAALAAALYCWSHAGMPPAPTVDQLFAGGDASTSRGGRG